MPGRKPRGVTGRCRRPAQSTHGRVVLLGGESHFAASLLRALPGAGVHPACAGHSPADRCATSAAPFPAAIAVSTVGPFSRAAADVGVPARAIDGADHAALRQWIGELQPDFLVLACHARRLPAAIAGMARATCVNVHPSLLPRYRGPEPLQAQLHAGERATGVTVHEVWPVLDAGPILLQQPVPLADGIDRARAESLLADCGAHLLAAIVHLWPSGRLRPRPQDTGAPAPARGFLPPAAEISTRWSARRAFNYVLATAPRGRHRLRVGGHDLEVESVTGFDAVRRLGVPWRRRGNDIEVQFSPGVLRGRARIVSQD